MPLKGPQHWPRCRARGAGTLWRSRALGVLIIVDRWRARQGGAIRARLVAPAIRARPALTDCALAISLKTQRGYALADRGKIVSGAGGVRLKLLGHAPVMQEDGCLAVKIKTIAIAGPTQP